MHDRLAELEAVARALEPEGPAREALAAAATRYAQDWLGRLPELPGYVPDDAAARDALAARPIPEGPVAVAEVLRALADGVDRVGVNESSGLFFGFIPGSGIFSAALGDLLAAVTNRYTGVVFAAPGAARLEGELLDWIKEFTGFPATAGGNLTSGGSLANLICVATARDARGIAGAAIDRAVVYLTDQAHHSFDKALHLAGVGRCVVRRIPRDARFRMIPEALDAAIAADRSAGLQPWLVVASAGTTDVGAVDPLDAIADLCAIHATWLHVDAAYGGAFALSDTGRARLSGLGRGDSLILDPHKGLFLPFGSGVALVRDAEAMRRTHSYTAHYMQDVRAGTDGSAADLSPELTRPFRGLRLWLPLQLHGVAAFRAALEEKLLLARYAHGRLAELGFEVGPEPDLSVVTFRAVPPHGDANAFNERLVAALQRDGRLFLSSTRLDGRFTLRLAILNARTHRDHVDRALSILDDLRRA